MTSTADARTRAYRRRRVGYFLIDTTTAAAAAAAVAVANRYEYFRIYPAADAAGSAAFGLQSFESPTRGWNPDGFQGERANALRSREM